MYLSIVVHAGDGSQAVVVPTQHGRFDHDRGHCVLKRVSRGITREQLGIDAKIDA